MNVSEKAVPSGLVPLMVIASPGWYGVLRAVSSLRSVAAPASVWLPDDSVVLMPRVSSSDDDDDPVSNLTVALELEPARDDEGGLVGELGVHFAPGIPAQREVNLSGAPELHPLLDEVVAMTEVVLEPRPRIEQNARHAPEDPVGPLELGRAIGVNRRDELAERLVQLVGQRRIDVPGGDEIGDGFEHGSEFIYVHERGSFD